MQLRIPQQQMRLPENVPAQPDEFTVWLQQLPMADSVEASKLLLEALQELNRSTLEGADRFLILEGLFETVGTLCQGLSQSLPRQAFPLAKHPAQQVFLLHGLLGEMANGYKIVVAGLSTQGREGASEAALQMPVFKALYYLVMLLKEHYAVYLAEEEGLWGELHALYRFAVQRRFHELALKDKKLKGICSVSHLYKTALLLALASPYHLMRGEIHKVFSLLEKQAGHLKLNFSGTGSNLIGKFVVEISEDQAPQYVSPERVPEGSEKYLVLDLSRLLHGIDQFLSALLVGRSKATSQGKTTLAERMERDMYLRLVRAWGERQERTTERSSQSADIELLVGLMECHYALTGKRPFLPEEQERKLLQQDRGQVMKSLNTGLAPKLFQENASGSTNRFSQFSNSEIEEDAWEKHYEMQAHQAKLYEQSQSDNLQQQTYVLQQGNVSSGGMMLQCDESMSNKLSVGELLAFHSAESKEWTISAVRWLMSQDGSSFSLGVKFLTRNAQAVAVKAVEGVGKGGEHFRALILDENSSKTQLLVPAAIFDIGTVLRIIADDSISHVRLTGLQDSADTFSLFKFTLIHEYHG